MGGKILCCKPTRFDIILKIVLSYRKIIILWVVVKEKHGFINKQSDIAVGLHLMLSQKI